MLNKTQIALVSILVFAVALRLVWLDALVERDEGQFAYKVVVDYLPDSSLYHSQVFVDNKQPLVYVFYAIPISLFGNDMLYVRLFNDIFFWLSCLVFYKICRMLFKRDDLALWSTLAYVLLMNVPYLEGQLVMSESIALYFALAGYYFLFCFEQKQKQTHILLALTMFLLSAMAKLMFITNFLVCIFIITRQRHSWFALPIAASAIAISLYTGSIDTVATILLRLSTPDYVPAGNWLIAGLQLSGFIFLAILGLWSWQNRFKALFILSFSLAFITCLLPNAYGHYFISIVPFLACGSAAGLVPALKKRQTMILILSIALLASNAFYWTLQYPDMNWDYHGVRWRYADSESRDMQERLASDIKNLTTEKDQIYVAGWEPYLCFRSGRSGCWSSNGDHAGNDEEYTGNKVLSLLNKTRIFRPWIEEEYSKCTAPSLSLLTGYKASSYVSPSGFPIKCNAPLGVIQQDLIDQARLIISYDVYRDNAESKKIDFRRMEYNSYKVIYREGYRLYLRP